MISVCAGIGNGLVFKLVPSYFSKESGTANGIVSMMGGLGAFPTFDYFVGKVSNWHKSFSIYFTSLFGVVALLQCFTYIRNMYKIKLV